MARLLLIFLLAFNISAQAQKGFYMGFAGNISSSLILNQNTYGVLWNVPGNKKFELAYDATAGYGASLKFGYNFKEQFGFEWHAGYQAAGMKYEDTDPNQVIEIIHQKSIDIDYATIAMAFRYTSIFRKNRYKQEQKVRLAIVAGPQIGILTHAALNYTLDAQEISLFISDDLLAYPNEFILYNEAFYDEQAENDRDFFQKVDVGLLIQAGVDIYPKPWFYISPVATAYIGFTDLNAKTYREHSGYGASRNASIGLNLSMGFYFNR